MYLTRKYLTSVLTAVISESFPKESEKTVTLAVEDIIDRLAEEVEVVTTEEDEESEEDDGWNEEESW